MPETPIVPFIPRSTLFILGMTARCRSLGVLVAHGANEERVPPLRRELIIEKLIRSLPLLPDTGDAEEIDALAGLTPEQVWSLSERHRGPVATTLRDLWEKAATSLDDDAERDFARRCGTLLTELFLRSLRRVGACRASSLQNA